MRFEKISEKRFVEESLKNCTWAYEDEIREGYNNLRLPKQGSKYSAGMDFFAPFDIRIPPKSSVIFPTGIRWITEEYDKVLLVVPRSGLGFKTGMRLENTVGVIDADYWMSDNEGHIMCKIHNPKDYVLAIEGGKAFAQGIIVQYFICEGAESDDIRNGGFGSTE